jgi:hypothetical protein
MAGMTHYLEQAVLNATLRDVAFTSPTTLYVALYTTATADDGSGTEVTGAGYARVATTSTAWSAPSVTTLSTVTNANSITFPTPTASWGTVTNFAILDAATGGNMLYHGTLSSSQTVSTNDIVRFAAGMLSISLD